MGYDMYSVDTPIGEKRSLYLCLNIYGMDLVQAHMYELDMLAPIKSPQWPEIPDTKYVENADPGTPWGDYKARCAALISAHPNRDDPRLPSYKLCSNNGWHVTSLECRALVSLAKQAEERSDLPEPPKSWGDWMSYIAACADLEGFYVR